jgi:uncharacterized protein
MLRFLILALVVALLLWLLFGRSRKRTAKATQQSQQPTAFAVCAHCGVHLPMTDAVLDGPTAYCSDAHRLAGPRERG